MDTNFPGPDLGETIDGRTHEYFAEATALLADLTIPINQSIEPLAIVALPITGGYLTRRVPAYLLESVISVRSAYTQVAGHREPKQDHGWGTLATAVVEGLNVLDIVTADRIVAQISTDHPPKGYVPRVSFLGTRFENLRIAGHPVELDLELDLFGEKPQHDAPYTRSEHFIRRVSDQHSRIHNPNAQHHSFLTNFFGHYDRVHENFERREGDRETVNCSLVTEARGSYPGHSCAHIIHIPNFGTISLAALSLIQSDYSPTTDIPRKTLIELTMIELKLGCIATGSAAVATTRTNGVGHP